MGGDDLGYPSGTLHVHSRIMFSIYSIATKFIINIKMNDRFNIYRSIVYVVIAEYVVK